NKQMETSSLKRLYYPLLIKTGSKASFDMIAETYKQSTGDDKEAAFKALITSSDFETIYLLLDILEANPPVANAKEAVNAILKLIASSGKTGEVQTVFLRTVMPFAKDIQQQKNIIGMLGKAGTFQGLHVVATYLEKPELKEAFNKGLLFILDSQYKNGGWPMFWPLRKGYYSHITFNDNATVNILRLLKDINENKQNLQNILQTISSFQKPGKHSTKALTAY
ncbi:MAG TPA: pectate lyase, partial [Bacteroidales bacterium]|nr:pectate lyase [Bacteroidales bacterium]